MKEIAKKKRNMICFIKFVTEKYTEILVPDKVSDYGYILLQILFFLRAL